MLNIYHNPKCSKSRQALAMVQEKGLEFNAILYLQTGLKTSQLQALKGVLKLSSYRQMMRVKEDIYKCENLRDIDDENLLCDAIVKHPILLERPIIVNGDRAVIARPVEKLLTIL